MPRILVIEDETDLQQVLEYNLGQAGYEVSLAASGVAGLEVARKARPDLILLDLMLPDLSGKEVCRQIKKDEQLSTVPVIMLTARSEEIDRIVGFELGADDYVTKPFSVRELMLRISAILKRSTHDPVPTPSEDQAIVFGVLTIHPAAHRVWVEGSEIELSALEFKLLTRLYDCKNRVKSRAALLDEVWGMSADITTRTVDTHVKRLREKLGRARDYIETVRGVGYRFVEFPDEAGD